MKLIESSTSVRINIGILQTLNAYLKEKLIGIKLNMFAILKLMKLHKFLGIYENYIPNLLYNRKVLRTFLLFEK